MRKPAAKKASTTRRRAKFAAHPEADGRQPPRGTIPPAARMRQPSGLREDVLPLVDVGSRKFELLCRDVAKLAFPDVVVRAGMKRRSGVAQYGVDVEGFDERQDPAVVISAKCYREVAAWYLRPWIDDFVRHLDGHWKGKNVRHFVLAVTHEFDEDAFNDTSRALVAVLAGRGIKFHLWPSRHISDLLANDPRLVHRYFGEYWTRAISADLGGTALPSAGTVPISSRSTRADIANHLQALAAQLVSDPGPLDRIIAERLERAIESLRAGRCGAFETWLSDIGDDPDTWPALSEATRARALRASAMVQLLRDDVRTAGDLLDAADELHPAPDRCAQAMLDRHTGHAEDALALLENPVTAHERELTATLLIEAGRAADALALIGRLVGEDVTPELLRLRAVAHFATGRRDAALRDASSAQRRAPGVASQSLTFAAVRFLSAFVPGVEGRFGDRPNPLHPALFLDTAEARDLLHQAITAFDRLAAETEDPFREAAEVWKLAGLLLHPDRGEDAASFAEVMLRRDLPDPVAVAWLLNFGRLRHRGRIKRVYHRELRDGRGSATMVVVLARLIVGHDRVERGAALIRRYRARFPRAQDLLDAWAVVFGDPDAPQGKAFATACRRLVNEGDRAPLVALLASDASVEDLVSGCDLLAAREAWRELDELRDRILTIGNFRAVELAALAALRVGKPKDCMSVLETATTLAAGGRLPRRLVYLRIQANEAVGRYDNVVRDLLGLKTDDEDERVDANLIEAYARIGALPQLRSEAEQALAADRLGADEALRVAQILKVYAPEVARLALVKATGEGIPITAAGAVASLAAELGLRDLQERSIGIIVAPENAGPHVVRFESVEDVLSHIESSARSYRDVFGEWLRGRSPAAIAMHSDIKSFAYLFLAEEDERRNQVRDHFPMLLRSGARRRSAPTIDGERPPLSLDISALLLARRLGMLDDVERAFEPRVAGAAPMALMAIEQELAPADKDLVATCREALRPDGRLVNVVATPPDGAVPLCSPTTPGELDAQVVARVLHQAYRAGHVDRDHIDRALDELGVTAPSGEPVTACTVSIVALTQIGRLGLLDTVSRGARLYMAHADRDEVLRMLASAEHEHALRDVVSDLRAIVSDRLLSGRWTVIAGHDEPTGSGKAGPAHLRSLQQVLAAVGAAPGLFWVEDRWLSHHRLEGGLDVVDVIDVLSRREIITPARRTELLRRLSEFRYAFLPVDADTVHAEVEAAPTEAGQVVESPSLAARRAWFVAASERARHLDLTPYPDEEGGIQGEVRHALDLNGLAREVLLRIWTSPTADRTERIARSEWVWTCLRAGDAPGWPDVTDATRRQNYAGLTAGWILDLPIVATLGGDGATDFPGAEFMEWFSDAHLSAMCRADPAARDAAVAFVAQSLAHLLAPDAASHRGTPDEVSEIHARAMAIRVRNFVDILPGDLGERVTAYPGVGDRLGLHTVLVLTFGDRHEVPVAHLADAYATCVASDGPTGADVLLADGSSARLSVEAGPLPLPDATLDAGSDRIELPPHVRALLHPDGAVRSSALPTVAYLVDPRGTLDRQSLVAVAEIPSVEGRLTTLEGLLDGDWFSVLQRLESGLRSRRPLKLADLALPAPSSIAAYLRLPPGRLDDVAVAGAVRSLRADLDAEETAARMAGLPIDLPPKTEAEMGRHFVKAEPGREVVRSSPLLAALRVRAAAAAGTSAEALVPGVVALGDALRDTAGVFVALVRHGASLALFDEGWMALEPTAFLTLLWSRADALARMLVAVGMMGDKLAQWVRHQTAGDLDTHEARRALPAWVARLTIDLGVETFATAVVGSLFGIRDRLAPESEALLRAMSGNDGTAGLSPPLEIAAPPPHAPLQVWPARDVVALWVEAGWTAGTHPFAGRDGAAIIENVLALGDDAATHHLLPTLLATLTQSPIAEPLLARARDILDHLDAERTLAPDGMPMFHALSARGAVFGRLDDAGSMLRLLTARAEACAEIWPDDVLAFLHAHRPPETAFAILAAAAFAFALALPQAHAVKMETYAACLTAIASAWPNARRAAIGRLDHLVRGLDTGTAAGVWPALIALRRTT